MRARHKGILAASLALNAGMVVALVIAMQRTELVEPAAGPVVEAEAPQYRTNIVVRRQNFTWAEIESDDYPTYIRNLQRIGCPPHTIRDIIVADVNQLFLHRRLAEVPPADHEWWRTTPDPAIIEAVARNLRRIEQERRDLLTGLLGADWETAGHPLPPEVRTGIQLSGPVLGDMAPETKEQIYNLAARAQQEAMELYETHRLLGTEPDAMEVARIRQQTRERLSQIMSSDQMTEFLLRYSHTAVQMREELHGLEFTPEQFRRLFQARDSYDQQAHLYYEGTDPTMQKVRENLNEQREAAIREAMGPEFYATYRLNQDPLFQRARSTALQFGAPPELVFPIYQINQATENERTRIRTDAALSNEEKIDALSAVQAEQQKSLERLLGPEKFEEYLRQQERVE